VRFLIIGLLLGFCSAHADTNQLSVGFGASVPKDGGTSAVEHTGPSRANGGERFTISFRGYKNISNIRLTGFSPSHTGGALIRSAIALWMDAQGHRLQMNMPALSSFGQVTSGNPQNYQNMVMLRDGNFVETDPNGAFYEIQLIVEGFANNDSGMLLQITSADGLPMNDFIIHRSSTTEVAGTYINEANYPGLSIGEFVTLMTYGTQPTMLDLVGKSFVCSSFSRTAQPAIDYKTRTYYNNNGALQSSSSLDGRLYTWTPTQEGWNMPTPQRNACGNYTTNTIIRKTDAGNLIAEVELNRYNYLTLCANAGYDWNTQAAQLDSESYPAVISNLYRTLSYEFCRPAVLP
jgi:hypothetical protein